MPPSPSELNTRLLGAVDTQFNITDDALLLEVLGYLEKVELTREDLTVTRLGLHINLIRKKAPTHLAKRLRKLVKSWQSVVQNNPTSNNASPASCYSPALNAGTSPRLAAFPGAAVSPRLPPINSGSSTPHHVKSRVNSPAASDVPSLGQRLVSPLVRQAGNADQTLSKRISPSNLKPTTPRSSASVPLTAFTKSISSRPDTPNGTKHSHNKLTSRTPTPPNLNNHLRATPTFDSTNRTHAANKKRRRSDDSIASDASSVKKNRHVVNGETARPPERIKKQKVKSTAELIKDLDSRSLIGSSDTITKIVTNQIEKEEDDIHASVVPVSAMPKFRRKHTAANLSDPPSARSELSKTKSDFVHRFLQESAQHNSVADDEVYDANPSSIVLSAQPKVNTIDMSVDPYSLLPPLDYDTISWSDEEPADGEVIHRNAITGEYPDGYEPPSDESDNGAADSHVEKVINGDWNGVTGTVSSSSQFHQWTDTLTISSSNDEPSDIHVLLPYVDL